jgi:hypothetical protein
VKAKLRWKSQFLPEQQQRGRTFGSKRTFLCKAIYLLGTSVNSGETEGKGPSSSSLGPLSTRLCVWPSEVNDPLRAAALIKGGRYTACNSIDNFRVLGVT